MLSSEGIYTLIKSYQSQADLLLENYVSAESFVIDTSIIVGIFVCKTVYDLSRLMSAGYFKSYLNLTKSQQIEWSNRAISTFHAVYIATVSLYLLFWSDLYSDDLHHGPITLRSSTLSVFALGVSVGYFLSDFSMIIWFYPSLGGMEYVIHHILSLVGVMYTMLTGEGQLYTYMVLVSEATTPWINLRWYLDAAGMKRSSAYIVNGVVIFIAWLVARILWFVYLFYHVYLHFDQVKQMHTTGIILVLLLPALLSVMNLLWFRKIFKGLQKTLAKRE
ncbi:transmembrane protein 56-B [Sesamum indicum]|uniref:Transmembrane protein 56-B n=1 Tax=Sesamum indicum TaxID=4182 RepID=A0A6I9UZA0_SESIN|nr:transmembrane protein 56-B [Sesamum indicum]